MLRQVGLLAGSLLPLLLRNALTEENTTMSSNTTTPSQGPNTVAIVVPTVVLGVLAILTAVLVFLFCVVKKKRQTEGTYRPSAEEQTGVCSVETPDALKLPKEERLI
ncbi:protein crumbs homolog 3-like [Myxocyprinus asiaticus]|uniref:protein crumbs homolog 3-like n=1 Tax=Myxocyprinus asiaticus TaxID=70543 RepID=UPI00222244B8|nr:protein crumbs homolog 3-like [Myxocyprinus asiaticus]XP_051571358.1 protein crumbs homolog 3-like [Myxocyprinus asiaticus]